MTALIATNAGSIGFISQDSAVSAVSVLAAAVMRENARGEQTLVPGMFPRLPQSAEKIRVIAGGKVVLGALGTFEQLQPLLNALERAQLADVAAVQRSAQSLWQSAGQPRPLIVVCMGFNAAVGKVEAFAANSEQDFDPQPLPAGEGHALTPAPPIDDPDYPELLRRWNNAAWGTGTQTFHRMAAQMMARATRASDGAMPAIGGMLRTAVVTGAGIEIVEAGDLDELLPAEAA
jgi:hypothetical protein